jgi:hypothetical protein
MMKIQQSPQVREIRSFYEAGGQCQVILDDFASRTNNQRITKVDQLLTRLRDSELQRSAVIGLFRKLEELSFGRFIEGRKGHPSRFVWSASSIEVGKAAKGELEVVSAAVAVSEPSEEKEEEETITHQFNLRPGFVVSVKLPADFTAKEADRLGNFLKALPI